jgi:hypothetical protein
MQPCIRIYYSTIHCRLNIFRAAYRSQSGALTGFASSGLHTHVVTGRSQVWVETGQFPLRLDYGRSSHAYVNQRHVSSINPAHHQEVHVVIVYVQPLVSSLSAGDGPVHQLKKDFLKRCTRHSPAVSDDTRGCTYTITTWTSWWWAEVMLETCRGV